MLVFLVLLSGYLLGKISIKGISLGTAGVLLTALVFGHFDLVVPSQIKNFGLILFVTAVGIIAGPVFVGNFKKRAAAYVCIGFVTIAAGALCCVAVVKIFDIPVGLGLGLLNGALTSTPGLAAALEASGDPMASVGYGIAYPFGVVGVVLFVQLMPKILKTDVESEIRKISAAAYGEENAKARKSLVNIDSQGIAAFSGAVVSGVLLGSVVIPLPGGASFSLGTSGGPLLTGLLFGALGSVGRISLECKKSTLESFRELGLALFLAGAGTDAGQGFVAVLKEYGVLLFVLGAIITVVPMFIAFVLAKFAFRLETMNTLGSICGGMTSTPALGTLIEVAKSDAIAAAYAATYPVALVMVVLSSQSIALIFG